MNKDALRIEAERLDSIDPLATFREQFHLPRNVRDEPLTYLCGHSLGLQPRSAQALVDEELTEWRRLGVAAHFSSVRPWVSYHERLAGPLAELVGAAASEVVAMNSLSVNLHLLLVSFFRPTRERHKILIEHSAFPSDRYAVTSHLRLHGLDPVSSLIEVAPREGEDLIRHEDLIDVIEREGASIATLLLPGVNFLSGQRFDIAGITTVARSKGCVVGFDLAHAIGNVPLDLHDSGVDFSVWCSYKYLNAGPGAIGGAFVHERHARAFELPRLAGWWGHDKASRFAMPSAFSPLSGAEGWQVSNPPILAMAPLLASLELFQRATMRRLREKSLRLTAFLGEAAQVRLAGKVQIITPTDPDARGSQLSLVFNVETATLQRVRQQLTDANIVCDWREPNVLRAAPVPLYNTFRDAWKLITVLAEILS